MIYFSLELILCFLGCMAYFFTFLGSGQCFVSFLPTVIVILSILLLLWLGRQWTFVKFCLLSGTINTFRSCALLSSFLSTYRLCTKPFGGLVNTEIIIILSVELQLEPQTGNPRPIAFSSLFKENEFWGIGY